MRSEPSIKRGAPGLRQGRDARRGAPHENRHHLNDLPRLPRDARRAQGTEIVPVVVPVRVVALFTEDAPRRLDRGEGRVRGPAQDSRPRGFGGAGDVRVELRCAARVGNGAIDASDESTTQAPTSTSSSR